MIYQVKCQNCPASYIGESGRTTKIRIKEHTKDIENKRIKNHIYTHEKENKDHKFNMSEVNILMQESQLRPRKFVEGVFSHFDNDSINRAQDIPTTYLGVLKSAIN